VRFDGLLVDASRRVDAAVPPEEPIDALAIGGAELSTQRAIAQQQGQALDEAIGAGGIADEAAFALHHELRQ
jgi:hypothetical protein